MIEDLKNILRGLWQLIFRWQVGRFEIVMETSYRDRDQQAVAFKCQ